MRPMLARTLGPKFNSFPCFVQPKLNGVRALYQQPCKSSYGVWQSRDEKVWLDRVLRHLSDELEPLYDKLGPVILDGELYVHGWRLQRINGAVAVNRKEPSEDTLHVEFHVFDVVDPTKNFSERWFDLYNSLLEAKLPHIRPVTTHVIFDHLEMERFFHHYTHCGFEGIMLRPDGPYEFGEHEGRNGLTTYRSKTLWKHKSWLDDEFAVVGFIQGEGKADIGVGALTCVTGLGLRFGVGTGFTDEERIEFAKNLPSTIKVRYLCLTDDGIPFNPSFICTL